MGQLLAIAVGGSFGAVLRFLVSSGIYQWLGKGFPYGTLVVNILGSFLLGLLTESLVLNRIAFTQDYRSAILVGFIGAFTTFSTFSLETVSLMAQGAVSKAMLNITVSVISCLLAVWLGLLCGKALSSGIATWAGGILPYALILVNGLVAFLLVLVMAVLLDKVAIAPAHQIALVVILVGSYLTLSGLYVMLYSLEHDTISGTPLTALSLNLAINTIACLLFMWLGLITGRQLLNTFY